jgi:aryl-alcohol dehydrogenase-like predicted oxidoreductase
MELRPLGATGLLVSPIGLGTVKFGRNQGLQYATDPALPDDAALRRLLDCAAELGINLLDTAPAYGSSEERLGQLLRGARERWILVSKAGEAFADGRSEFDFSAAGITASVEQSLQRLRTDRIDVLLLHSDGADETAARFEAAIDTLSRLKQAGKLRAIGLSSKTVAGGLLAVAHMDMAMVTLNREQTGDRTVIAAAHRAGKGILIKKALASGRFDGADAQALQAAMALVFAEPGVSAAIIGTHSPAHLAADVQAAEHALRPGVPRS